MSINYSNYYYVYYYEKLKINTFSKKIVFLIIDLFYVTNDLHL